MTVSSINLTFPLEGEVGADGAGRGGANNFLEPPTLRLKGEAALLRVRTAT
jgi:hypothetical protein